MQEHATLLLIVVVAVCILSGALLFRWCAKRLSSWRLRRRFKRGADGETRAAKYLIRHGFTILGSQVERAPCMWVDGKRIEYTVRADFLVRKAGRKAVIEVKTGAHAVDPASSGTRRQIMEYANCYDVDDIYLFDAESGHLRNIRFGGTRFRRSGKGWWWIGAAMGFAAGVVAHGWLR